MSDSRRIGWRRRPLALLVALLLLPPLVGMPLAAGDDEGRTLPLQRRTAIRVATAAESQVRAAERQPRALPHLRGPGVTGTIGPQALSVFATQLGDPALRSSYPRAGMDDSVNGTGCDGPCLEPPDPWIAVGPSHVVQVVNRKIRITNRTGGNPVNRTLPGFFSELAGQQGDGDSRIIWDQAHGRWIGSAMSYDCSAGHVYLAVSQGGDPTGGWTRYRLDFHGRLMDYPGLGLSEDKVVLAVNQYQLSPSGNCAIGGYLGASLHIIDLEALFAAPSSLDVAETAPSLSLFTWRPAVGLTSGNDLHAFVEVVPNSGNLHPGYAKITGTVGADSIAVTTPIDLTATAGAGPFVDPPAPRQPGTPAFIAGIDSRPTDALWKAGSLWTVATQRCRKSSDSADRACVRVIEYVTTGAGLRQDFLIGATGLGYFGGGIGIGSDGRLFVAFSRSSSGVYASTYVSTRALADPVNRISKIALLVPGLATYRGSRWGDYVGVATDPSAAGAVWVADEYPSAAGGWSTWVQRLIRQTGSLDGTITINGGATTTTDTTVTLKLVGSSPAPITVVRLSNSPTLTGGQLALGRNSPYQSTISWSLTDPSTGGSGTTGTRFVYAQFGDGAGNWSTVRSDSIILE